MHSRGRGVSLGGTRLLAASSNTLAHGHRRPDAHGDLTDSFLLSSRGPILQRGSCSPNGAQGGPHDYQVTGRAARGARPPGCRPWPRNASGRPSPLCCRPSSAHQRRHPMRWTGARTRTYWRFSRGPSNASERLKRRTNSLGAVTSLTSQHGGLAPAHTDLHSHPQERYERSHGLDDYCRARRSPAGRPARRR